MYIPREFLFYKNNETSRKDNILTLMVYIRSLDEENKKNASFLLFASKLTKKTNCIQNCKDVCYIVQLLITFVIGNLYFLFLQQKQKQQKEAKILNDYVSF